MLKSANIYRKHEIIFMIITSNENVNMNEIYEKSQYLYIWIIHNCSHFQKETIELHLNKTKKGAKLAEQLCFLDSAFYKFSVCGDMTCLSWIL